MSRNLLIVFATSVILSCAPTVQTMSSSPGAGLRAPESGHAAVILVRTSHFEGRALLADAFIDGRRIGSLAPGTFRRVDVGPGAHEISSAQPRREQKVTINAAAGGTYFVEVDIHMAPLGAEAVVRQLDDGSGRAAVSASRQVE